MPSDALRRVVVTGVGLVTPLGVGVGHAWPRILRAESGIVSTSIFNDSAYDSLPSRVAGLIPRGATAEGKWNPSDHLSKADERQTAPFTQYALAAAEEALEDAGLQAMSTESRQSTAVVIGSGIGNLSEQYDTSIAFDKGGHHKTHPLYVPRMLINMAAGHIAIRHGFKGPNLAPTTACTTGLHALIEGAAMIRGGMGPPVDMVVAGASEAAVHPLAISGFARARSLSTGFNDTPELASRPFDKRRDGFVIGEGAGVVVLEERERALERGATIYAELAGVGMSCDASHMTAPAEDGGGAHLAMKAASMDAGQLLGGVYDADNISEKGLLKVDYVNAHATSTALGDAVENRAVRALLATEQEYDRSTFAKPVFTNAHNLQRHPLFKRQDPLAVAMSSTKGATGHLLGAAGAVEAIFTLLAIRDNQVPPTLNLIHPGNLEKLGVEDPEQAGETLWDFNYVPNASQERDVNIAFTNSFGFGGTNASICFVNTGDRP